MRSLKIFLLLALFSGLTLFSEIASAQKAPDFAISESQRLSDFKGQVIYLDFWASWCKPCRKSFPWMNHIQEKYAELGFKVITINLDKKSDLMNKFLQKYPANFVIVTDPQSNIAEQYQIQSMPSSYIIDSNGEIKFSHRGFFEKKRDQYQQQIESLLLN